MVILFLDCSQLIFIPFAILFYGSFSVEKQGNSYTEVKKDSFLTEFFEDFHL